MSAPHSPSNSRHTSLAWPSWKPRWPPQTPTTTKPLSNEMLRLPNFVYHCSACSTSTTQQPSPVRLLKRNTTCSKLLMPHTGAAAQHQQLLEQHRSLEQQLLSTRNQLRLTQEHHTAQLACVLLLYAVHAIHVSVHDCLTGSLSEPL